MPKSSTLNFHLEYITIIQPLLIFEQFVFYYYYHQNNIFDIKLRKIGNNYLASKIKNGKRIIAK